MLQDSVKEHHPAVRGLRCRLSLRFVVCDFSRKESLHIRYNYGIQHPLTNTFMPSTSAMYYITTAPLRKPTLTADSVPLEGNLANAKKAPPI